LYFKGPDDETHEKEYHAYYQWVPLVLAFQAIMFYTPHFLWKVIEGGRMKVRKSCRDINVYMN